MTFYAPIRLTPRILPRHIRHMGTASSSTSSLAKKEGDISSGFVSLSNTTSSPLPPRFAALKSRLIAGHEATVTASWHRLLAALAREVPLIAAAGRSVIPEIQFSDLNRPTEEFVREHRKRGVAIIRGVVDESTALGYKSQIREYIRANPQTKAFPQDTPQVYELYWSASQIRARAHPNMLEAQKFLMGFWRSKDPNAKVSVKLPTSYVDRLRIRMPGDNKFSLGPHVDGGSVERWEEGGYGLGGVYDEIWKGRWEEYDPFEASCRLPVESDLYGGAGACSMFRMYQGWLSMSHTAPAEGTLLVNPLLGLATAYYLLRPFFTPIHTPSPSLSNPTTPDLSFLSSENWTLNPNPSSSAPILHGATPGHCQELSHTLHPHLDLPHSMVSIPTVRPGDYVAWHCDTIHAVDVVHAGSSDSSVLYIPACPLTEANATYLARQRDAFLAGTPGPDFPGGVGESGHVGRSMVEDVERWAKEDAVSGGEAGGSSDGKDGLRAFGFKAWDADQEGLTPAEREVADRANEILGFYG